jgi:hypothetical protein
MNKHEFIAQLSKHLRVSTADQKSILEEYESYIQEALANGEREEDVIASLETPEEIAANANAELGSSFDEADDHRREPKQTFHSNDFFDDLDKELEKGFKAAEKAISKASESISQSMKAVNLGGLLHKVMDGVDKVVDGVMDIDIKGAASVVAMRFDNSKVESFAYDGASMSIEVDDENHEGIVVEVVPGQTHVMVKYLPTTLKCDVRMDGDRLVLHVPQTSIKFAEKKRLRLYIPESVQSLLLRTNAPLTLKELTCTTEVVVQEALFSAKDVSMDRLTVNGGHGPVSLKDAKIDTLMLTVGDGPLSIKKLRSTTVHIHGDDGPVTLQDCRIDACYLEAGVGPKMIKDSQFKSLTIQSDKGPLSIKDSRVDVLKGQTDLATFYTKDCHIKDNQMGDLG